MKTITAILAFSTLFLLPGCFNDQKGHHDGDTAFTTLDIDQANKLSPFMVDLKREGALETFVDSTRAADSTVVIQQRTKQTFSFRIMVDKDDHPVPPDSVSVIEKRGGGRWNTGSITTWCFGGCIMVNTQLCLVEACKPMDNACGCIPPNCGVCEVLTCSSIVSGFTSGRVVMR